MLNKQVENYKKIMYNKVNKYILQVGEKRKTYLMYEELTYALNRSFY